MAALHRPTNATYETHENVTIDTQDNEDHTFCGIMFPVKCKDILPVDHLVIKSVSVRGQLGSMTVWVSNEDGNRRRSTSNGTDDNVHGISSINEDRNRHRNSRNILGLRNNGGGGGGGNTPNNTQHRIPLSPSSWTKLYEKHHDPCPRHQYTELVFNEPVRIKPGELRAFYIHSTLPGDKAIVYDNSYYGSTDKRFEDDKIIIITGRAHVSTTCFGQDPIWGWGNAWRDRREFVGRISYGTVYKLWNPEVQPKFGRYFQDGSRSLFLCQRRWESPFSMLPDEAIFYILNMCRWDWFEDDNVTMKERRKREKVRNKHLILMQKQQQDEAAFLTSAVAVPIEEDDDGEDAKPGEREVACAHRAIYDQSCTVTAIGKTTGLDDSEEENEDFVEMDNNDDDDISMGVGDDVVGSDEELDSDDDSSDEDEYHRANSRHFSFRDIDSDGEDDVENEDEDGTEQIDSSSAPRNEWFQRQSARIRALRALASGS
mmetsp:Transcript_39419/g.45398  ORF Transcript_39419/g.45398 Transcript_39419/m.45398 type:complete len:486 (+) Transcript_39419:198-1655(+)